MSRWIGSLIRVMLGAIGASLLFLLLQPLWLGIFWGLQGYPPTLRDFALWYQIGAFNAIPAVGVLLSSMAVFLFMEWLSARRALTRKHFSLYSGGLLFLCLPVVANLLLIAYARILPYWTPDAALNYILKGYLGYLVIAPPGGLSAFLVGLVLWRVIPPRPS
jgi:hypothetical protein